MDKDLITMLWIHQEDFKISKKTVTYYLTCTYVSKTILSSQQLYLALHQVDNTPKSR